MDNEEKKEEKPRQVKLQLQLDEETAQGRYVNFGIVNHTPTEFVLDFVFIQPGQPRGKVLARIITSPMHAKRFQLAMAENLARFEARFGPIRLPDAVKHTDPIMH